MKKTIIPFLVVIILIISIQASYAGIIHIAANNGNLDKVKRLVSANPDLVNERDLNDKTPLHFAAFAGHPDIAEYLIEKGADVNAKDVYGMTPLQAAALRSVSPKLNTDSIKNWKKLVKELREYKTPAIESLWKLLDDETRNIITLLYKTGSIDDRDKEAIIKNLNALLEKKDFYEKGDFDGIELDEEQKYLMKDGLENLSKENLVKFNRVLLESIFPDDITRIERINGNYETAKLLIEKGADINAKGSEGATALHLAILYDNDRIAELLIEKGADFNIRTKSSYTPLYYAYMKHNKRIINLLEKKGANQY